MSFRNHYHDVKIGSEDSLIFSFFSRVQLRILCPCPLLNLEIENTDKLR